MRRYLKLSGFLNTYKKSFCDNLKKSSNEGKKDFKSESVNKSQTLKQFMAGLTKNFNMVTHKVSDTLGLISNKLGLKKEDRNVYQQNIKSNKEEKVGSTYYSSGSSNPKGKDQSDTTFDENKMGGGTQEAQSRAPERDKEEKKKSKLDIKFGGGSSYGSSRIGKYSDEKSSTEVPQEEKRTFSVPSSGSAVDESGSQTSKPLEKDIDKDKKPKH
jgi:hypothetical protein